MTLIDKAEALAPCPFCGGEATFSEGKTGDGKPWHYVECSDCGAMGPSVSYADHNIAVKSALADAWNRRSIPARGVRVPTEDIDALAYRFWSIHPKDIPEAVGMPEGYKGGKRAWFYATEIRRILAALAHTDAAQAREAAMQELIDAYEDIIDYGPLVLAKKDQWERVRVAKEKLK